MDQPLSPPLVTPRTKYLCRAMKTITTGTVSTTDAAIVEPQSTRNSEANSVSATGAVREPADEVTTDASTNSCHDCRNAYIPAAASPGAATGSVTYVTASN